MNTATIKTEAQRQLESFRDRGRNANNYRVVEFSNSWESWDDVFASNEWNELWEGWQGKVSSEHTWRRFRFMRAYRVETNPETNYGRDFDLYFIYSVDGITHVKVPSIHSVLSTQPMRRVMIFSDSLLLTEDYFKKTPEARKYLKETGIAVI